MSDKEQERNEDTPLPEGGGAATGTIGKMDPETVAAIAVAVAEYMRISPNRAEMLNQQAKEAYDAIEPYQEVVDAYDLNVPVTVGLRPNLWYPENGRPVTGPRPVTCAFGIAMMHQHKFHEHDRIAKTVALLREEYNRQRAVWGTKGGPEPKDIFKEWDEEQRKARPTTP